MDELIRQITTYARGMWRRRWVGLGFAWLVGLIGAGVLFKMPDKYEASARVYVDTQSILKPLMSGLAVQPDVEQQINILSRTLISRPNIEKLIRMADLDLQVKTPKQRDQLIDELSRTLQIKGGGRENLYTIAYRDSDRNEARRVVQSLLSIFVESSLGDQRKGSDTARRFIEDQIRTYEKRLEEAENRVKEFKLKNMGLMGPDGRDYFTKMTALGEELNAARSALRAAEQSRDALKREVAGEDPVFLPETQVGPTGAPASAEIDARIDALKRNMDELLRRYTDQHPDVAGTRRVIAQLEEQKREEAEARKKAAAEKPASKSSPILASTNPVFQQLRIALAESEANIASLRAKAGDLEARYRQLQALASKLPQVEAELAQLNRDYDVQKKNYESLLARRESASLANQMDAATGLADFRIIDPPTVAQNPVAPNRLVMLPGVLAAALGAGLFASFVLSQIVPTFPDVRALRELTQRPVLGTVSLLQSPAVTAKRRRGVLMFAGGVAGLVGMFATAILLLSIRSGAI
ncbi:MAG TPA: XrtA system polysaccharide chain length determinant [Burkholderiales bacterium]|jgi:polysaccharide chain length determinant protein (PEP-CTERM system associated)|nr:XrtA system polysaccharide chain length determinant [Burkholderiales bacterium]